MNYTKYTNYLSDQPHWRKWSRAAAAMIVAMLFCTAYLPQIEGAAGDLDTGFGNGGVATNSISTQDNATAVAIQSDGRIVVVGRYSAGGFAVSRYLTDGTLDPSFGLGGSATINFGSVQSKFSVAIQNDGKIIAVGTRIQSANDSDFLVMRYGPDGTLDPTFGIGGAVTTDFFGLYDVAAGVAIDDMGMIVVAGHAENPLVPTHLAVARYLPNGDLDLSFGFYGGKAFAGFALNSGYTNYGSDVAIQSDGKILVAGSHSFGNFSVVRFEPNGEPDQTFGSGGGSSPSFGVGTQATGTSVAVQPDGGIVLAGKVDIAGSVDFGLIRLDSNGFSDTSFDVDGRVTTDFLGYGDVANDVAIQSDGKIVAVGAATIDPNTNDFDLAVARYEPNGSLDQSFGNNGRIVTPLSGQEAALGMALQSDCRIVAVGFVVPSGMSDSDFAVVRYDGGICGVAPPSTCPQPQGYWKNSPDAWPVDSLILGTQTYSKPELLALLNTSTKTDASIILARQLIAAKLNLESGSDAAAISSTIDHADSLLAGYGGKLGYKVNPKSAAGKSMVADSKVLDGYNNGICNP